MAHVSGKAAMLVVLVGLTLLSLEPLQGAEGRAIPQNRVKRAFGFSSSDSEYLGDLYNRFQAVFQSNYRSTDSSNQFAVATINRPQQLHPCSLVMNNDLNPQAPSTNYLAYTPQPSTTRPGGMMHSETSILNNFAAVTRGITVVSVYLITYFSPCRFCTNQLRNLALNHLDITFYIGYVVRYQNEDTLNYFIDNVGSLSNVCYGQITPPNNGPCHDELRRRSSTCPVHPECSGGGGGCFPSTALVQTRNDSVSMEDLKIGDEVLTMNANGQLLYSPVIAFLDQVRSAKLEYIKIETENKHRLQLTSSHLTFTNESSKPLYASDVQTGDYMFTAVDFNDSVELSKVTQVDTVSAVGKYAPLTAEGTVIVDGILASCYADVNAEQGDIHALFAPLQFLYNVLPRVTNDKHSQEGIHWYPRTLMQVKKQMIEYLPSSFLPSVIAG